MSASTKHSPVAKHPSQSLYQHVPTKKYGYISIENKQADKINTNEEVALLAFCGKVNVILHSNCVISLWTFICTQACGKSNGATPPSGRIMQNELIFNQGHVTPAQIRHVCLMALDINRLDGFSFTWASQVKHWLLIILTSNVAAPQFNTQICNLPESSHSMTLKSNTNLSVILENVFLCPD